MNFHEMRYFYDRRSPAYDVYAVLHCSEPCLLSDQTKYAQVASAMWTASQSRISTAPKMGQRFCNGKYNKVL